MNRGETVATRELMFSFNGDTTKHKVIVRLCLPFELGAEDVTFEFGPGTAGCRVEFDGLDEPAYVAYGADSLQALQLASNIDPVLRGLAKKYDFFFESGEEYFTE